VTQQLWNPPPAAPPAPGYGGPPNAYPGYSGYSGYPTPAFTQPPFGAAGIPQYGPAPNVPSPRPRRPGRLLLLALIVVGIATLAALAITSLSSRPSDVAYANDDYQVPPPDTNPPPLPTPQTYDEAEQWITANTFYSQTAPLPVRCNSQPINVTTASDEQLKSHFDGLMECLVRVWQPPVTGAGWIIVRPTVTIYGEELTTKCGTTGVNAFYCSADQQIYYSNQLPRAIDTVAQNKWTADLIMAHEYGHLLQGRTGILISAHAIAQRDGDDATKLAYVRRLETQADCFSGMFIRSASVSLGVQQQDLDGILATYVAIGDDTLSRDPQVVGNHGLARSRKYWGNKGLSTSAVNDCNTFVAPPNLVR
jgi:predicted metalloprotease